MKEHRCHGEGACVVCGAEEPPRWVIPPIGPTSEGTGELAGGDVQPLPRSHHPRARKETKHDQRTPLPGDPDWEEHRRGGTHG